MAELYQGDKSASTASLTEVPETAKNTGFSELSLSVTQVSRRCHSSITQETLTSVVDSHVVSLYVQLVRNCASLKGKERMALSDVMYRDLIPTLIRKMKKTELGKLNVEGNQIEELFEIFFQELKINAERAGHDVEEGIQYSEAVFMRFAEMWQKNLFGENDWLLKVRQLIARRNEFVHTGAPVYPAELQQLEAELLHEDVRLKAIDAALVLLCWEMSRETQDGIFFLAIREAARYSADITRLPLKDDNHAKVVGRAGIEKLKRLGIIEQVKSGMSRKAAKEAGLKKGVANTFRWCFAPKAGSSVKTEPHRV